MITLNFPRIPVNPKLEFGVPLNKVCEGGVLHPGLRELFLKTYLSAGGEDRVDAEKCQGSSASSSVLQALKPGLKGQGMVADRISLKLKLETGKWIVATQTPAGAPLWLLRHFLGRLPQPLLQGTHWRMLAVACGAVSRPDANSHVGEVLQRLVQALEALPPENYLTIAALVLLFRNLSAEKRPNKAQVALNEEALGALSQYFTASLISRPYRPGLYTSLDKEHKPLLEFLSKHWPRIRKMCKQLGKSLDQNGQKSRMKSAVVDRKGCAEDDKNGEEYNSGNSLKVKNGDNSRNASKTVPKNSESNFSNATNDLKKSVLMDILQNTNFREVPPKDVRFSPYNLDRTNRKKNGSHFPKKLQSDLKNADFGDIPGYQSHPKSNRSKYHAEENQIIDEIKCLHARKVMKDKASNNPEFDVKNMKNTSHSHMKKLGESEFIKQNKVTRKAAETKVNGTQTFECEFSDDREEFIFSQKRNASVLLESNEFSKDSENGRNKFPRKIVLLREELEESKTLQINDALIFNEINCNDQSADSRREEFGKSSFFETSNTIVSPQTCLASNSSSLKEGNRKNKLESANSSKSDFRLLKLPTPVSSLPQPNLTKESSKKERSESSCNIHGDTESVFFSFPNSNMSTNTFEEPVIEPVLDFNGTLKESSLARVAKMAEVSSTERHFASELKCSFKNGRRKPTEAKLLPRARRLEEGRAVLCEEKSKISKALRLALYLREKAARLRSRGSSRSLQELIEESSGIPISTTNSV